MKTIQVPHLRVGMVIRMGQEQRLCKITHIQRLKHLKRGHLKYSIYGYDQETNKRFHDLFLECQSVDI